MSEQQPPHSLYPVAPQQYAPQPYPMPASTTPAFPMQPIHTSSPYPPQQQQPMAMGYPYPPQQQPQGYPQNPQGYPQQQPESYPQQPQEYPPQAQQQGYPPQPQQVYPPLPQPQPQPQQVYVAQGSAALPHIPINLRTHHSKFVDGNYFESAFRTSSGPVIWLVPIMGRSYAIRTALGKFVSADHNGKVLGKSVSIGPSETWTLESYNGHVSFKSWQGKYLCAESSNYLIANRQSPGQWELFTVSLLYGKHYSIQSCHGKFVCAEKGHSIVCNRLSPTALEKFKAVAGTAPQGTMGLITHHNRYLCAENTGVVIGDRRAVKEWESFRLEIHEDGLVAFFTYHNTYLCADNDTLVCNRTQVGAWEKFRVVIQN